MGFDDGNFQEVPNRSEYEAWEARKARATKILEQIARANCGEDAIGPIMEILEQADAKNDLRAELNKKDLQNKELKEVILQRQREIGEAYLERDHCAAEGDRLNRLIAELRMSMKCGQERELELIRKRDELLLQINALKEENGPTMKWKLRAESAERLNGEMKAKLDEIQHIATLFWNGKPEGPLGMILDILLGKVEKRNPEDRSLEPREGPGSVNE